jgi:flagellar hook-basal body complex protein FliE
VADPISTLRPAPAGVAQAPAAAPRSGAGGEAPGTSFGALLERVLNDAVDAGHKSEKQATAAVAGGSNLQDVVEAVNAAELTLQTVVAVRDRIISAYQEIMRMPM